MKWVVVFVLLTGTLFGQDSILTGQPSIYDEFSGLTYYSPYPQGQWYNTVVYPVVAVKVHDVYDMSIVFHYVGNEWIFFKNLIVLCDGQPYYLDARKTDTEVLGGGLVSERIYFSIRNNAMVRIILERVASAKEVKVRFSGKYIFDKTLSQHELALIKKYFLVYEIAYPHKPKEVARPTPETPEPKKFKPDDISVVFGGISFIALLLGIIFYVYYQRRQERQTFEKYLKNKYQDSNSE